MAGKQRLHRQPIASGNARNQHLIGGVFPGRPSRRGGGGSPAGECDRHGISPSVTSRPIKSAGENRFRKLFQREVRNHFDSSRRDPCPEGRKSRPSVVCGGAPGERIWPRTLCPDSIIYPFEPFPAGTRLMIKGELDSPP